MKAAFMKFIVAAVKGGFVVARRLDTGDLVAESDHLTRKSAEREAYEKNTRHMLEISRQMVRADANRWPRRKSARYIEPDAFA